jgi:hypothetical protein
VDNLLVGCLHCIAAINKVVFLVKRNFKHTVNISTITRYNSVNLRLEFSMFEIKAYKDTDMKARPNYHVISKINAMGFMRKQHNKIGADFTQVDFDEMKKYFSTGLKQAADKK